MLYFDRIEVSEGTEVNKISASKECDVCHYVWYFLKIKDLNSNQTFAIDGMIY